MSSTTDRPTTQTTKTRWAVGVHGALAVLFGVVILVWPGISLEALTILFGAYVLAAGIVGLAAVLSGTAERERAWLTVLSLFDIVLGTVVLLWPDISALSLLYVIGFWAIALGVIVAAAALWLPLDGSGSLVLGIAGLVSILFGVVMVAEPGDGALVLLALIAAYSLVVGLAEIVFAIDGGRLAERGARPTLGAP